MGAVLIACGLSMLKGLRIIISFAALWPWVASFGQGTLFQEGFESGALNPEQWTVANLSEGRVQVSEQHGPYAGKYHLILDDRVSNEIYSRSEAILKLNLAGHTNVVLSFAVKCLNDEPHPVSLDDIFQAGRNFDGVAISPDGERWTAVYSFAATALEYTNASIILDPFLKELGVGFSTNFLISFVQYDNFSAPLDGYALDNISVAGVPDAGFYLDEMLFELPRETEENGAPLKGVIAFNPPPEVDTTVTITSSLPAAFAEVPNQIVVKAGQTSVEIPLTPRDNSTVTGARVVSISVQATGYRPVSASIKIIDDDLYQLALGGAGSLIEGRNGTYTVALSSAAETPVTINLRTDPPGLLVMPATVTLGAGSTQGLFTVTLAQNNNLDGNRAARLIAESTLARPAAHDLTLVDDDPKVITLGSIQGQVSEGAELNLNFQLSGIVTTPTTIVFDAPGLQVLPAEVILPTGGRSGSVQLIVPDDKVPQTNRLVTITASAEGFIANTRTVVVVDNDPSSLRLTFNGEAAPIGTAVPLTIQAMGLDGMTVMQSYSGQVTLSLVDSEGNAVPGLKEPGSVTFNGTGQANVVLTNVLQEVRFKAVGSDGLTAYSGLIDTFGQAALPVRRMVADPKRNLIYVTLPSEANSARVNEVVAIDPTSGSVIRGLLVGSQPDQMVVTSDGAYLYVDLEGSGEIVQVDLEKWSVVRTFALGSSPIYGTFYAADMCAVEGAPGKVLVSLYRRSVSPSHAGVALFADGVRLGTMTQDHTGSNLIEPSADPNIFFGYNTESTEFGFRRLSISNDGVRELEVSSLFQGFAFNMVSDGNYLVTGSGLAANGMTRQVIGNFATTGVPLPDIQTGRVFFLQGGSIQNQNQVSIYDPITFSPLSNYRLLGMQGAPAGLIRYGKSGLAALSGETLSLLSSDRLVPSGAPADLETKIVVENDSPEAGENFTYKMTVFNHGPNPAEKVSLSASLTGNQVFVEARTTQGTFVQNLGTVSALFGTITNGGSATVEITMKATQAGILIAEAAASSNARDLIRTNQSATATVSVGFHSAIDTVNTLDLAASDLVADPLRPLVYAAIPARLGDGKVPPMANSILPINPMTGRAEAPIKVGGDPMALTISDDGKYIYLIVRGAGRVERVNLESRSVDLSFPVGENCYGGCGAEDIVVMPGKSETVLVSLTQSTSPRHVGVRIFDNGVPRAAQTQGHTGSNRIEPSADPNLYFGYNNETTEFGFRQIQASSTGLQQIKVGSVGISGFGTDFKSSSNFVFSTSGVVIDGLGMRQLATLSVSGFPAPDLKLGRVFYLSGNAVRAFSLATYAPVGDISLNADQQSNYAPLIIWGADGLAWLTGSGKIAFARTSLRGDTDNDGLPDQWELSTFGNLDSSGNGDTDADGFTEVVEFQFGTNPRNGDDRPVWTLAAIGKDGSGNNIVRVNYTQNQEANASLLECILSADLKEWIRPELAARRTSKAANGKTAVELDVVAPAQMTEACFGLLRTAR